LRLHEYIGEQDLYKARLIDFGSWIRCLCAGKTDRKTIHLCLEQCHLAHLLPMTPLETMELKRLSAEFRSEKSLEWIVKFQATEQYKMLQNSAYHVTEAFIRPWLTERGGLTREQDIVERLQRVSTREDEASHALEFLRLISQGNLPFVMYLFKAEEGIYCDTAWRLAAYKTVREKAETYFYNPSCCYKLNELVMWITRELARAWIGYEEGFIEKTLRISQHFKVQKGKKGLEIRAI
jgi:hypothetical protein